MSETRPLAIVTRASRRLDVVTDLGRPVDVACLNVGIGLGGAFADTALEDDLRVIAVNVTGTVHLAKRVVQHMLPRRAARVLVVSSISATTPTPYETVYGPSKAFGFSFAESLREELRDSGIRGDGPPAGRVDLRRPHRQSIQNRNVGTPCAPSRRRGRSGSGRPPHRVITASEPTLSSAQVTSTGPIPRVRATSRLARRIAVA